MVPLVEARLAVAALVAIFLIPIAASSLRGIGHVLTCREQVETPFQVILEEGTAIVTGATTLSAHEEQTLCGGLAVDISVAIGGDGAVLVTIPIENRSSADWFGTVQLDVDGTRVPVDFGRVPSGEIIGRTLELGLPTGATEFDGTLLVGP